jgi:glycine/D-amino acid oxidase-like deaminating enzyme
MVQDKKIIVIGGGIVGASAAYYLCKRGYSPILLEKGEPAGEQSGRNWGFVRQQGRDPAEVPLMMRSNQLWAGLENELGENIEWCQGGNLLLTNDAHELKLYQDWADIAGSHGLDSKTINQSELADLIPRIEQAFLGGLYTASDGQADPVKATNAFCNAAERLGAKIFRNRPALGVEIQNGKVHGVRTADGILEADYVVCAAGAWTSKFLHPLGLRLPQQRIRGSVAQTTICEKTTDIGVWAPGVAFRQRRDGSFSVAAGNGYEVDFTLGSLRGSRHFIKSFMANRKYFDIKFGAALWKDFGGLAKNFVTGYDPAGLRRVVAPTPNSARLERALKNFKAMLPSLGNVELQRSWAGYIDMTPDALPVIDALNKPDGLVIATGFSGHGFGLGPSAGTAVAELIADGKSPIDLSNFTYARFPNNSYPEPFQLV